VLDHREELGLRVGVVSFAIPEYARLFRAELGLGPDVLVLCDPERELYARFRFGRASFARVWLDPRVWARYAALIAKGRRPRPATDDTQQLGGDVLLDADGRVVWVYRSRGPEDRPSLDQLSWS
jgi:hypothetical protein